MQNKIEKYINQDINNPIYLFNGSPHKLEKVIPRQSSDSNNNDINIANEAFLFPSLTKASAYAFKEVVPVDVITIKYSDFKKYYEVKNSKKSK